MATTMIRLHSGKEAGTRILPSYQRTIWIRNGIQVEGHRRDIQVGDLSGKWTPPVAGAVIELGPVTRIERISHAD
jgi:hypothetical protein